MVQVAWVPGSFELPVVAKAMAKSQKYGAVVAIGVIVSHHSSCASCSEIAGDICSCIRPGTYLVTSLSLDQPIRKYCAAFASHCASCPCFARCHLTACTGDCDAYLACECCNVLETHLYVPGKLC